MLAEKWNRFFADQNSSRYLIHRLLSENFRTYARKYALAFVFMGLVAASTALSAWIMRDVVNEIFVDRDFSKVWLISGTVMVIFIVKGLATYGQTVILALVGNAIVADHQRKLYRHFLSQGADFFHDYPSSELITRISHNAQAARNVLNMLVTSFGRDLFSLIGLILVMVIQDPIMSMIAFFVAPPAIYAVSRLVKRVKKIAKAEFLSLTQITQNMQESALGYRIIRTFGLQSVMGNHMGEAITGVELRANKIAKLGARTSPLMETLGGIAIAMVILYSGYRTIVGGQSPGEFISFLTALLLAYEPAKRLSRLQVGLESGLVGVRLMFEILDRPSKLIEKEEAKDLQIDKGSITFNNVSFSYQEDEAIIKGLTLTANGGERTALVGPSGGGKSTLLALVQRFYDVSDGSISVDGQDIRELLQGRFVTDNLRMIIPGYPCGAEAMVCMVVGINNGFYRLPTRNLVEFSSHLTRWFRAF